MREYIIATLDGILRRHPDCGIILIGDFNQLHDMFLRTQYGFAQLVNTATRNSAILDKLWTNMDPVYDTPAVLDTIGTSDHRMVLLKPSYDAILDTGNIQRAVVRRFTANEKAAFASALSDVSWEHLYTMTTCEEQFNFFQRTMEELMVTHFPYKSVTRHTADKPWVTDYFRHLIRQRQRDIMSVDIDEARRLRNLVNRTAPKLRQRFYHSKIATLEETSSKDWWKHMKNLMGAPSGNTNEMQGLANKCTEGDMTQLVNSMNDFFVSVSADLPRLDPTHRVFDTEEPLPA